MKKISFLIGSFAVAAIACSVAVNSVDNGESSSKYEARKVNEPSKTNATEMMKIWEENHINVITGKVEKEDYTRAKKAIEKLPRQKAAGLVFEDRGPDNIGGRTRGIAIHPTSDAIMYAGSVSGGLFKSTNGGNNWTRVQAYDDAGAPLSVSTLAISNNGTLYVGTGSGFEGNTGSSFGPSSGGHYGDGIWYSTDGGASFQQLPGTNGWDGINQIVVDKTESNKIWIAGYGSIGLQSWDGTTLTANAQIPNGVGNVRISNDGNHIVCSVTSAGMRTYVSHDGGATFTNVSGNNAGQIPSSGISRLEYAISRTKNSYNKYTIYASAATSILKGIYISEDNGDTWYEIAPQSSSTFMPFSTSVSGQGTYNNIISAEYGNPNKAILGGIDLYGWEKGVSNPPYGQWQQLSIWYGSEGSPVYVHADNHELVFNSIGELYIGNDGGVFKRYSQGGNNFFASFNRGYNVTQFYSVAFGNNNEVMGGAQDNGTLYIDGTGITSQSASELRGGDGFDCDISWLNPEAMYSSVYYTDVQRTVDGGITWDSFVSDARLSSLGDIGTSLGSFYSTVRLWETKSDVNSQDSILFENYSPQDTLYAGDTVKFTSTTLGLELEGIITVDTLLPGMSYSSTSYDSTQAPVDSTVAIANGDTTVVYYYGYPQKFQDPIQTWTAIGVGGTGGVWVTRDGMRFGHSPQWYKVIDQTGNRVTALEFSSDGNHLYVGTSSGQLYRVSNLNEVYSTQDSAKIWCDVEVNPAKRKVTDDQIGSFGTAVGGIAVDPQDPDHVVVTLTGYGGGSHSRESNNATAASPSFSNLTPTTTAYAIPMFDAVIDRNDPNIIVIATEFGVCSTDDGGATWAFDNNEMGIVPVHALRQQWRDWDQGVSNPGVIYAGTHGRGIWSTGTLMSIDKPTEELESKVVANLSVYPNPMTDIGRVAFDLLDNTNVRIEIYNLAGKLVQADEYNNMPKGSHTKEIDVARLPIGTYIVKLDAGTVKKTAKFVVIK